VRSRLEVLRPIAAIALAAVFFFPIYIVVMGMLKPADKIQSSPLGLPLQPTGENLGAVLGRSDGLFWSALLNSVQITVLSVVLLTLLSAMLAHYLVRSHALWTKPAMLVLLAGLMIPPAVILQPVTQVLGAAGLMNSVVGVVASNVAYYPTTFRSAFSSSPGSSGPSRWRSRKRPASTARVGSACSGRWCSRSCGRPRPA